MTAEKSNTTDVSEKTKEAMESLAIFQRKQEGSGYAVMGAAMSYGGASQGSGIFGKLSRAAFWFCIWFAMIAPVLLFWRVVL